MKRILLSLILSASVSVAFAQTVAFSENFELPSGADSVASVGVPGWSISTALFSQGAQSMRGQYSQADSAVLTTNTFSTVGNTFVKLQFWHIAKIEFFDFAIIQVSNNGGTTWTSLTCPEYLGTGNFCASGNKFASNVYLDWLPANATAVPTNAWWKYEEFDISAYAANSPNARVRFIAYDNNFSGMSNNYGWMIDDIKVIQAPCEIISPSISLNVPVYSGNVYSGGPFNISANITDVSGIDSAIVVYTVNAGTPDTLLMSTTTGSNTYQATIPSQAVGATVCYTVYAWDDSPCGNLAFSPAGGSNCFTVTFSTPSWCTGAMISTFPWTENFETFTAGTGASGATVYGTLNNNWTRNPGPSVNYGWGVRQGTTASAGTGPNIDNTLQTAAGKYMFCEANLTGTAGTTATLTSPCLDFSTLLAPKMDFYYHMFGPGIGTLEVEMYNGFVWTSIWSLSGQQQTSSAEGFRKQTVDLSVGANSIIQVRFKATKTSNTIGDIAIDDVYIYEPQPNDVGVIEIISPDNAGCDLSTTEQITVRVANMGTTAQTNIPVAFQINGGAPLVEAIFQTLQPSDTVTYTFTATANLSTPAQTYTFNAFTLLVGEQTPSNDSVQGYQVVNTLQIPAYFQSFDNFATGQVTSGSWLQDLSDNFNWNFLSGTTPTANTGPPGDHTSGTGKYAYIENNNATTAGQIANLVSPCIDLRTLLAPKLEFWYHMYGGATNVGTLNVQVQDSSGVWTTVWTLNGNQGNQWIKALVNLTQYAGQIVLIRFQGITATCCTGDIAIDDVLVFEPQPDDLGVTAVFSPLNGACSYTTDIVSVEIVNFGTTAQDTLPMAYSVNGGPVVLDTLFLLLPAGDTTNFTFTVPVNLAGIGQTFNIDIYTNLSADNTGYNDTASVSIFHPTSIIAFPHTENFESFTAGTGIPTTNPGTLNNNWSRTPDGLASQFMWHVRTGSTSTTTGPSGDNTPGLNGLGKYIYTEVNYGTTGSVAYLTSPCLDFTAMPTPYVEYYFHRFGSTMGKLVLEVLDGNTWIPVDSITGQQQTATSAPYQSRIVNIFQVGNSFSRVRWRGHHQGCCNGDMAIDDVKFYQPVPLDASCIAVLLPGAQSAAGNQTVCQIQVRNFGTDTLFAMNLGYTVNGGPATTQAWTGVLPPLATFNFTFTQTFAAPTGQYTICGFTALAGDQAILNDTACKTSIGVPVLSLPYFTDFENGVQSWVSADGFLQWQLGVPSYAPITSAYSPTNAWMTNLTGIYQNNSNDMLYTPLFDFNGILGATMSFWHNYNTENTWDGGNVQYSLNGGTSWTILGSSPGPAGSTNWYNATNIIGLAQPGWMGNSSGWVNSTIPLTLFNNAQTPVRFRFRFGSDASVNNYAGWAIDNFEISIPVQHSAATTEIIVIPSNYFILPAVKTVSAYLKNTGIHPITSVQATLEIDNVNLVTDALTLSTPLPPGDSILHVFSSPWNAAPGLRNICVYTSFPNTFTDGFTPDDTLCYQVTVFDSLSNFPYCNDFEGSQPPLVELNTQTFTPSGSLWEQGTPSTPFLNNAYSGSQCWTTNMTGNYNNQDSSALYTPVFNVRNDSCYRLSFYHKFKTEVYQDGGIVEYSQDGGATWIKVGGVNSSWYNTAYVTGLSGVTPGDNGWSGQSSGWVYSETTMLFPQAGTTIIRFRFGSDLSITDEGWSIDNICFEQIAPCTPTSVEETPLWINSIYPNPSGGIVEISVNSLVGGSAQVEIVNMLGQTLFSFDEKFAADQNVVKYDLSNLSDGVYFVRVNHGGKEVIEKLIISK